MKQKITVIFIIAEAALYTAYMTLDLIAYTDPTFVIKYTGMLVCTLFTVYCAFRGGEIIIPVAMIFSTVADTFLLLLDNYYNVGLSFFLVVQCIFLYYLFRRTEKIWIPARIVCPAAILAVLGFAGLLSGQNMLAGIYYSVLLVNVAMSWFFGGKVRRTLALGLTLFACCDLCVGLINLDYVFPVWFHEFIRVGMWMFYLPAQVLIAFSMDTREESRWREKSR